MPISETERTGFIVNPIYWGNTYTIDNQPIQIIGYQGNKGIAQYQDGQKGLVGLPDNWTQYIGPEVTVIGTSPKTKLQQAQTVSDLLNQKAYDNMTGEERYNAKEKAAQTRREMAQIYSPEELNKWSQQSVINGVNSVLKDPAKNMDKVMLGTITAPIAAAVAAEAGPIVQTAGQWALSNPYINAALTSIGGAHAYNSIKNGSANAITALELMPMVGLGSKLWNTGVRSIKGIKDVSSSYSPWAIVPKNFKPSPYGELKEVDLTTPEGLQKQKEYAKTFVEEILIPRAQQLGIWNQEFVDKWNLMHPDIQLRSLGSSTWGFYNKNGIKLNDDNIPISTLLHELRHSFDANSSGSTNRNFFLRLLASNRLKGINNKAIELTPQQEDVIRNAYLVKNPSLKHKLKSFLDRSSYYGDIEEMIATNTEAQAALYNQFVKEGGMRAAPETFYEWIDSMDEMELVRRIEAGVKNGYWQDYKYYNTFDLLPENAVEDYHLSSKFRSQYQDNVIDWAQRLKKALKIPGLLPIIPAIKEVQNSTNNSQALGGILSKNSDSAILADNNNYIQDFKGKQYGLPTVRYDKGGLLVQQANMFRGGGPKKNIIPGNLPPYFSYDKDKDEYISDYYSDEDDAPDLKWWRSRQAKELKQTHRQVIDPDGGKIKYVPIDVYKAGSWKARGLPNPLYEELQGGGAYLNPFEDKIITGDGKVAIKAEGEFDEFGHQLYETDDGNLYTDGSDEFSNGGSLRKQWQDLSIKEKALGGHLFGNGGDGRTTLPRIGDSWRNTETDESGTVVGYAPDVPYMGEDGKLYPTTSPVVKYDSGETLFGVTPQYTLPEVTATGHLRTPADNLDKVMLGTLATGVAPIALPEIASGATAALANPYVDAALTSYFGAHGINDIANGNANAMTALEVLPMARLAKPLWNAGKSAMQYTSKTVPEAMTLFNSPLTGKWATFGNKQYRFRPGYIGMNGTPMESRPLYSQSTEPEFLESLPIDPERYYRYFDTNALKSYKDTGVVSQYNRFGINNSPYPVPMFSKGQPSMYAPKGSVWAISKPESNLQWEAVQGNAVSPLRNGEFNKAPISDFDFYREIPGQGYVKLQEDLSLPKGVTYSETPHIDYLNTLNEQQQIEYLTQNGLNDAWLWTLKNNPSHLESALRNAPIGMPQKSLNKIATGSTAQEASKSQNSASDFDSFFDLSSLYNKSKQIVRAEQEEAIREAEQKVFDYLGSERHIQRIMEGGKSREEAERIARHMWENAMTAEGELGPLGAAIHGEYDAGLTRIGPWWKGNFKYTLDPKYTINENLSDNAVRRNVFHELGGHGATLSYGPAKSTDPKVQKIYEDVVKEWFPEYKEVYDHNAALKPVRRPQFENAEEVGLEDGMLHYLEDVDEYSARARAENIEPGGDDFGALYRYFTPESLENLKNNVWGTIPLVLGTGLTGYGLYDNFNSTNSDIHAYGGPLVQHANKFIIED